MGSWGETDGRGNQLRGRPTSWLDGSQHDTFELILECAHKLYTPELVHELTSTRTPILRVTHEPTTTQFTFTTMNVPSNTRGHILQQEQNPQGYQHGSLTRGIFLHAMENIPTARRRPGRNPLPPVAVYSDREEKRENTPCSKTNDDKGKKGLMDLCDSKVQEETRKVINELLFKLRQVIEDRDRLIAQLKTARKKHIIPVEEKEQPPSKCVDRGPRTMGMFQITPTSSLGIELGSQLSISVPPRVSPSSGEPSHDNKDIVMKESTTVAPRRKYEDPVEITPARELQNDDKPPRPTGPTPALEQEDPFGLDESDQSEPETRRKNGKGKKKSTQDDQRNHALNVAGPIPPFWRIRASAAGFPE